MCQIGVGKIKLPRFEIANHFDLGHSPVYRGCHRLFPALKPFQTVSSMEGRREWRKEGRALNFPTLSVCEGRVEKLEDLGKSCETS